MRDRLSSMTLSPNLFVYKNLVLYIVYDHIKTNGFMKKYRYK